MIRIAICEDERIHRQLIEQYIRQYAKTYEIQITVIHYDCGKDLLQTCHNESKPFDIIILDIYMNKLNGMETAKSIRQRDEDTIIIFLTSAEEFVFEGYIVNAFRYLLKPLKYDFFHKVLTDAICTMQSHEQDTYLLLKTNNHGYVKIKISDILYLESQKRRIRIVSNQFSDTFYGKLTDCYENLKAHDFLFIHQSYLVQIKYIDEIHQKDLLMENGDLLPISKYKKKEVQEIYFAFLREGIY